MKPKDEKHSAHEAPQSEKLGEVTLSREEYEKLQERVKELEELKDKMMRTAAEYENAKKRLAKERDDFVKFSQERLIGDILPILDNFERGLAHASQVQEPQAKNLVTGLQMAYRQLSELLKSQGLTRLETKGKIFDPHLHEAVAQTEESGKDHEILEELEAGYQLHGRLLRAAKVRIRVIPGHSEADSSGAQDIS